MKWSACMFLIFLKEIGGINNDWDWLSSEYFADDNQAEIEYYVNLIREAERNSLTYVPPKNSEYFRPKHKKIIDFGSYDFIVVGAGSGGSVVANRLSEIPEWRVLLLEAGTFGNNLTDIPNMYFPVEFTEYNWGYVSTPQEHSCLGMVNKQCPIPRGKGIGGTTLINGLVYARGHKIDFDRWAALGNPGWSYKDVLPYFIKSENFNPRWPNPAVDYDVHGVGGYLNVEYNIPTNPQVNVFLKANEEIGVPVADYNDNKISASASQLNTIYGRREDGGKAFIYPILNKRKNLDILPHAFVTQVILNEKYSDYSEGKALGVVFSHHGYTYIARVTKDVILSAGAYNTPQLLMLSGIGPKKHLREKNIKLHTHLEVGSNLKDHATFYGLTFDTTLNLPAKPYKEYVKDFLKGLGPLSSPGNNGGVGFYESSFTRGTGYPDIEIMMIPANATTDLSQRAFRLTDQTYYDLWARNDRTSSFILYIICLHCKSLGTVRLKSSNPYDFPVIDPRYLSDPYGKDIQLLYEGIQIGLELSKTKAFQKINARLQGGPLKACSQYEYLTKEYWYCAIRQVSLDIYHPVSTCPMGPHPEKGDVVDARLKVYGFKNLRVIDGSVFPFTLAGHPNAPIVMVGEKGSDIIKQDYGKI